MRRYFAYIRVSTTKQGQEGVSLEAQRDAITRYAQTNSLEIIRWFEEQKTAAKRGRPTFIQMLKALRKKAADGVLIHKIDRSARNLKDWADLGEVLDQGIEVRFAGDSLDMASRGGRLSADIQAVVASDYIRNLREETRKGFYGRLKQGLYPLPAPLGYLDRGKGNPKALDPATAGLIRTAFALYATGNHTLETLTADLARRGLRNKRGKVLRKTAVSYVLNNPFYMGLIRLRRTRETFKGIHEAIVQPSVFNRVQEVLSGRYTTKSTQHEFLFRRILRCANCGLTISGERQKGHTYYRCHSQACAGSSVRAEVVEGVVASCLQRIQLTPTELAHLLGRAVGMREDWIDRADEQRSVLLLRRENMRQRLAKVVDAYLDGVLDRPIFEERKAGLLREQASLEELVSTFDDRWQQVPAKVVRFLELLRGAYLAYKLADWEQKRAYLKTVTSNLTLDHKTVGITLAPPFRMVEEWRQQQHSSPDGI